MDRVYVGNIDWKITSAELKEHMESIGEVVSAEIFQDSTGRSRGVGLVQFTSPEDANSAIAKLNDSTLGERMIFVREDRKDGKGKGFKGDKGDGKGKKGEKGDGFGKSSGKGFDKGYGKDGKGKGKVIGKGFDKGYGKDGKGKGKVHPGTTDSEDDPAGTTDPQVSEEEDLQNMPSF